MERNQKAAIIALIAVVILSVIAVGLIVYEVRTEGLPTVQLPDVSLPQWLHPTETPAPSSWPQLQTPQISTPQISTPKLPMPQINTPALSTPAVSTPKVTPPPEAKYESVFFGQYEQGDGKAPIEWYVLEKKDDRCLLISRRALDMRQYHGTKESVTWETCSLRAWLNREFLELAFTPEEREAILTTEVDNSTGNPIFGIPGGNNTEDRVFLLSREEVDLYFPTEGERLCEPTKPIKSAALLGYCSWWLRSPGSKLTSVQYVNNSGAFLYGDANRKYTVIRPVLWVAADSLPDA